jgi:hypothetical protein
MTRGHPEPSVAATGVRVEAHDATVEIRISRLLGLYELPPIDLWARRSPT